jgi:hypothetical protein
LMNLEFKNHIKIEENEKGISVPDGVLLYYISYKYVYLLIWIYSGLVKPTIYSKFKFILKIS